jgi:hypothetical protein
MSNRARKASCTFSGGLCRRMLETAERSIRGRRVGFLAAAEVLCCTLTIIPLFQKKTESLFCVVETTEAREL